MKNQLVYIIGITAWLFSGCSGETNKSSHEDSSKDLSKISMISTPASQGSGEPNLFTNEEGKVFLTWIEENEGFSQLKFSLLSGSAWDVPNVIAEGENWFVNWADFPSLAAKSNGKMAAHYLAKNGKDTFAYGVNLVFSSDEGMTWSNPIVPHETKTETEHGFVSLLPYEEGYFAAWLDGRNTGGGHGTANGEHQGAMSIRAAFLDNEGNLDQESLLDDKICDCCQTSAVFTGEGPIVAYRDRSDEEIRDISIVRWTGSGWSDPKVVHADNWVIPGCPVNGPVLAASDSNVALAWFTSPDQHSKIKLTFSKDAGETFGSVVQIDNGHPIGRLDMEMIEDGSVYISWMEAQGEIGQIMLAHYSGAGDLIDQFVLADNRSDRASGFPRMTRRGKDLIVAWRDIMNEPKILTARIGI